LLFLFSSRRRHTRFSRDWSSDVCSSDLASQPATQAAGHQGAQHPAKAARQLRHAETGDGIQEFSVVAQARQYSRNLAVGVGADGVKGAHHGLVREKNTQPVAELREIDREVYSQVTLIPRSGPRKGPCNASIAPGICWKRICCATCWPARASTLICRANI